MKRKIWVVLFILLVGSTGLIFNSLSPREADGQGSTDPISNFFEPGLDIAGVYQGSATDGSTRVVTLHADGTWSVRVLGAPPSFGVWQPTEEDMLMLDATLVPSLDDPQGSSVGTYTLTFTDDTYQSVMVTNTATMDGFTAERVFATNGTGTMTDTTTTTDTTTMTDTTTETDTTITTDTETETDTTTGTATGTDTGTATSP